MPDAAVSTPIAHDAAAEPLLRVRGLGRRFGGVHAVRDADLDVHPGERRAILGPNGAGKSTLFNLIAGEVRPTEGTVELFGRDVSLVPVRRRVHMGLARTFQTSRVLGGLSIADNLYLAVAGVGSWHLLPLRNPGDRRKRERAREAAERVGLSNRLETLAGSLSHGEQRQLEVGLALASEPRLLMLDEPAAGLSRGERLTLTRMLVGLDRAVTLIIIEHDMDVALTVADRVTMMHDGRVILEGSPSEVRASKLVHDLYLGSAHHGR
jgi:branched-chain amino acid transport system ATP-binding protein